MLMNSYFKLTNWKKQLPNKIYQNTSVFSYFILRGIIEKDKTKSLIKNVKFLPYLNKNGSLKKILFQKIKNSTPLAQPYLGGNEIKYLTHCINTNWISSQGKFLYKFEKKFQKIFIK